MALSNIFREPKRELIEQAYGLAVIVGFVACDFAIAALLVRWADGTFHTAKVEYFITMVVAIPVMFALYFLFIGMHALGEVVCGAMARAGFDPRPKDRR